MVFSFHEPESLYAEVGLASVAALIVLYRLIGGQNEWFRTHGVILSVYYAFGAVAYDELENWKLLDTTYFLTVTVTTVGYGDMCPETNEGKLFTVVYALFGLVFVFAALSPLLDALIFVKDLVLKPFTPKDPLETDEDGLLDLDDLRARGTARGTRTESYFYSRLRCALRTLNESRSAALSCAESNANRDRQLEVQVRIGVDEPRPGLHRRHHHRLHHPGPQHGRRHLLVDDHDDDDWLR